MKKFILFASFSLLTLYTSYAQRGGAVELSAEVQKNPARITLNWRQGAAASYIIKRKDKTSKTWTSLQTVSGSSISYIDNAVEVGKLYEYSVEKSGANVGYGYIISGIEVPAIENRGRLILLIDSTFITSLASEIAILQEDLESDGWRIVTTYVGRNWKVPKVKSEVVRLYNAEPTETKALFILGHVPVAYSGDIVPDGHEDHKGAWPADVYYGDMNGSWTDNTVTSTPQSPPRTQNKPGDGRFDQSKIPSEVELQVGRVDLSGMTKFNKSELDLMKNYLKKDHEYRKKIFTVAKRGIIDDNFGDYGADNQGGAFVTNAWKNFAPLVHSRNVIEGDYLTTLNTSEYLWSFGSGAGTFESVAGVENWDAAVKFSNSDTKGIFTMLLGSYFGDWDTNDNMLRQPLCQGKMLTNAWVGRPHWMFHHMGMGENIGYSTRLTQNNTSTYYSGVGTEDHATGEITPNASLVHIALMGDPTLRNDIVSPVSNVNAAFTNNNVVVSWNASPQQGVLGYNVYIKKENDDLYFKANSNLITGNSFTNISALTQGVYKYMVRAIVLENTPSGTYYNMSEGITDTTKVSITITSTSESDETAKVLLINPNPAHNDFDINYSSPVEETVLLSIINTDGKKAYQFDWRISKGTNIFSGKQLPLAKGTYVVTIQSKSHFITSKIRVE